MCRLQKMRLSIIIVLFAALWTLFADGNEILKYGITGTSVRLLCDVQMSDPPVVEWSDMVYTSDTNPSIIFQTENNPHFNIAPTHTNRQNYIVHRDFALTIDLLDLDQDPGSYTCRSLVDDAVYERHYYLTVGESPSCSGDVHLFEGNSSILACELTYSGRKPSLQWLHNGEEVESVDEYEVRLAKKVISVFATPDDDQSQYTCRMSLGDHTEECSLVLDVKYLVRDLKLTPVKEKYRVGDELECSAKGNPAPTVTLLPVHEKSGPGWKSLRISHNWEGQKVNVQCTASNTVGPVTETQYSNLTIHLSAPRKSLTTTSSVIVKNRTFKHHVRHSSASPPPAMRSEKDQTRPGGHHRKPHQHHHSTTALILNEHQQDMQEFPAGDDKREMVGIPGTKPVQGKTNHADQMNNLGLFRTVVFLLLNLILTIYLVQ